MEPEVQSGEDYVNIYELRTLGGISLSESMVNMEEDLLEEDEKEEVHSDAGSVITGDDNIWCGTYDDVLAVGTTEKLELPEEFANSVMVLTCESTCVGGSCDVFLVGTAHVSQESCREVESVISSLKPQVVFVELCASRLSILKPQALKEPTVAEMIDMWRKNHNLFGIIYGWFLAKIARQLEVFPGAEFRVAFEEANKYGGKVILGDRPVKITLQRTWGKMPLWHKIKFVYNMMFQAFFLPKPEELDKMLKDMNDKDMLTLVIEEMSKQFPTLMDTLVHERDKFMASYLLKVASEHSSVVAVVGRGHLQGIKKNWNQPIQMKELSELPTNESKFTVRNIGKYLVVVVAVKAIVSGIYLSSTTSLSSSYE